MSQTQTQTVIHEIPKPKKSLKWSELEEKDEKSSSFEESKETLSTTVTTSNNGFLRSTLFPLWKKFSSPYKQEDGKYVVNSDGTRQMDWTVVGVYTIVILLVFLLIFWIIYSSIRKFSVPNSKKQAAATTTAKVENQRNSSSEGTTMPTKDTSIAVETEAQRGRNSPEKETREKRSDEEKYGKVGGGGGGAIPQRAVDEKDPSLKALAHDLFGDLPSDYTYSTIGTASTAGGQHHHISFEPPQDDLPYESFSSSHRFNPRSSGAESISMEIDAYNPKTYGDLPENMDDLVETHAKRASQFALGTSDSGFD
jgi:hypothetical protein